MPSGRAPAPRLRPHRSHAARIPRTFACVLLGALLGTVASSPAHAEPSKEELQVARTLFGQALAEEKLEHWEAALGKLESVQAIKASPSVRFHIALCEEKLGRLAAALSDYEAARVAARTEGNREVLESVEEPIARLTAEVPHLTLTLATKPPAGARIEIDGKNLTVVGFNVPIPLDPGPHTIVASAPEHAAFKHSLVLQRRADVGVQVVLKPYTVGQTAAAPDPVEPPTDRRTVYPARPYAIATTAGALVLAGAGVGLFLGAGAVRSANRDGKGCMALGEVSCDGPISTVQALDVSAGAAWIGAAGLAAASVVLWTRPGRPTSAHAPAHTRLAFGPGRIALEGTFE